MNAFEELYSIDVSKHVEKKGRFTYLSWPYAVAELRKRHPEATWEVIKHDGVPYLVTSAGVFVEVSVTVNGVALSQIHPVLNAQNKPIYEPNAFDINTSIQRCLVKAIALHGLGLYIYAGEDLPEVATELKEVKRMGALSGIGEELGPDVTAWLQDIADYAIDLVATGNIQGAKDSIANYDLDETQNLYMQSCIKDSKTRKALGYVWVKTA